MLVLNGKKKKKNVDPGPRCPDSRQVCHLMTADPP